MTLSKWQRRIVFGLAAVVAIFTGIQFLDGNIEGMQWLLPALVVGGLLFVAVAPSASKPSLDRAAVPAANEDRTEVLWSRVTSLADRMYAASKPYDGAGLPEEIRALADHKKAFARITAICCAYSTMFFTPRRNPPMVPSFDAFMRFRRRALAELTLLVSEADRLHDRIEVIPKIENLPSPSEHAERMLTAADDRRMRSESEMNFVILAGPMVEGRTNLSREERAEILMAEAQLIQRNMEETVVIPSMMDHAKLKAVLDAAARTKPKS